MRNYNIGLLAFAIAIAGCGGSATKETQGDTTATDPASATTSSTDSAAYAGMVHIKGGSFQMGSDDPSFNDTRPVHAVNLKDFWMDTHEVTNAEFKKFVDATGYKTVAEQQLDPKDFPGVDPASVVPGSGVFTAPAQPVSLDNPLQWWRYVAGASWQHPYGPQSNNKGRENYPVVNISYDDAKSYAHWAGKRLPTEAEWEYAARANKPNTTYYWGNELHPGGKMMSNNYQGHFPDKDTAEDGFKGLSPVMSFPPNANGLYDMEGNVWEWCSDFYRPDYYAKSPTDNPQGPSDSFDPDEPGTISHVQRGGSFICSEQYCIRYKAGSRGKGEVKSASDNLGFRCVKD
ncbi:formylglycine-generating enzyme family protein [Mucilaginibacter myungsuensis]|nr:formylglycine-generating enzyme family protein [Mucilaginibacter myungsuensis]MDN3597668.1 formylglycine-generating enzyme family protein [Mucilaginibacter myungsuensis]